MASAVEEGVVRVRAGEGGEVCVGEVEVVEG